MFFKRCDQCRYWCIKEAMFCPMCRHSFVVVEPPHPDPTALDMEDPRRLRAIHRLWERAQACGRPHSLAEVVAYFDDRPMKGKVA